MRTRQRDWSGRVGAVVLAAMLLTGCGEERRPSREQVPLDASNADAELHVAAVEPEGAVERVGTLFVRFVEPAVEAVQVGKPLSEPPLRTEPPLQLEVRWVDRSTLSATVLGGLPEEGPVTVRFAGTLAGRTDRPGFRFVVRPVRVRSVEAEEPGIHFLPTRPRLRLRLSRHVPTERVAARCLLIDPDGGEVALRPAGGDGEADGGAHAPRAAFAEVQPARPLAEETEYRLVCRGMGPWDEERGRAEDFEQVVRTAGPFRLLGIELLGPDGTEVRRADPDDVRVLVRFSTPVDPEELAEHVSLRPEPPWRHAPSWRREGPTKLLWRVRLDGPRRYRLVVDGALRDELGRSLGKEASFAFRTTEPRPALRFHRGGPYVLDAGAPGFEVAARSVSRVAMRCAKVPRRRLVPMLEERATSWIGPPVLPKGARAEEYLARGLRLREHELHFEGGGWQKQLLDVPERCGGGPGFYVVRLEAPVAEGESAGDGGTGGAREVAGEGEALVNVTDLGVFLKVGAASSLAWVVRLSDGQPVHGARVTVFARGGRRSTVAHTDEAGVARLPGTRRLALLGEDDSRWGTPRLWVLVEAGEDVAALETRWNDGIATWNFDDVEGGAVAGEKRLLRAFLQTDRGLYRPGETVRFHGYVRVLDERDELAMPPPHGVTVRVRDSRRRLLVERKLRLSRFGSFSFSLPLGEEASLGRYTLELEALGQKEHHDFRVEEFRRATVELKVEPERRDVLAGEEARVRLQADFLHGSPVAGAPVRWTVQRRHWWPRFPAVGWFAFQDYVGRGWSPWYGGGGGDSWLGDEEGRTDAEGEATLAWKTETGGGPFQLVVTAEVTPSGERPVTKRTAVTVHPHDRYVGLLTEQWVVGAGEPLGVQVALVSSERKPLRGKVRLRARRCVRHKPGAWRLRDCLEWEQAVDRVVRTGADGKGRTSIELPRAGTWALLVETEDGRGETIVASDTVWVTGPGASWWAEPGAEHRMQLVASKRSYEPGETATLVPMTQLSETTALLTLERRGVMEARVQPLPDPGLGLKVPLAEAHAPGVYATVLLVRPRRGPTEGPTFQMGLVRLPVSLERRRLRIQVEPARGEVEPGDPVQVRLRVTDADGAPVRAELAVAVPDEGVLQVAGYRTPDPLPGLYRDGGLAVATSASLLRLLEPLEQDDLYAEAGEGADGEPKRKDRQRKKFPPLAYWNPRVETDERGEALVEFQAPDGLTAYRVMVVGADLEHRFGSGEARVTVSKKLMVEPSLPRFVRPGDQVRLPVAVTNRTGEALEVDLRAWVRGAAIEPKRRAVKVAAGQRVVVHFDLGGIEKAAEKLSLRFRGRAGALQDDVALSLPVRRPEIVERVELLAGRIEAGERQARVAAPPAEALGAELVVRLDRSGLGELGPALEYLVKYPYGCLEQTLSRMMPLLAARELGEMLDVAALKGEEARRYLAAGVAKVQRFQRYDGRFRLWAEAGADVYLDLSALAVWGLHRAERAGFQVDPEALQNGIAALRRWALEAASAKPRGDDDGEVDTYEEDDRLAAAALAAFVLAQVGEPAPELEAKLMEQRDRLGPEALGWLWAAVAGRRGATARRHRDWLREKVGQLAREREGGLVLRLGRGESYYGWSSDARATAVALLALVRERDRSGLAGRFAEGLKALREEPGRWVNTQANFWAITALFEYARRQGARGPVQVRLRLGEREESVRIEGQRLHTLRLPVPPGGGTLRLEASGPLHVYALRQVRLDASELPAREAGFRVERRYEDPRTGRPVQSLRLGQLVRVVVEVQGVGAAVTRRFLAAAAPLPAGLEPVNTALATEQVAVEDTGRWDWRWDHRELRDDRVLGFRDEWAYRQDKPLALRFLARATSVGRFLEPGAFAEAMYRPQVQGRAAARWVEVAE